MRARARLSVKSGGRTEAQKGTTKTLERGATSQIIARSPETVRRGWPAEPDFSSVQLGGPFRERSPPFGSDHERSNRRQGGDPPPSSSSSPAMPTPKKKARPVKKMTARSLPKLETPVGDPIRLQLTTPAHVVDAHVVLLSGCKDEQESADVSATSAFGLPKNAGPGGAGGACTNAMLKCMYDDNPDDSWLTVLVGMQSWLRENGYDQVPQISCGNDGFDFRRPFSLLHPRCGGDPRRAGRTRAVLIGVNYVGTDVALDGAWNDVEKMRSFLHDEAGFSRDKDSMRVLRDNGTDAAPTKANIEKAMRWLVLTRND